LWRERISGNREDDIETTKVSGAAKVMRKEIRI
jgi:hypothetical protein